MLFLAREGVASDAFPSQGWIFTFEGLAGAEWVSGDKHTLSVKGGPWSLTRPLWGLMLGCFRLFLEKVLVGGRLPAQGPSVRAATASPGEGRWELPHFAAAPARFEQEEQDVSSLLPGRCPGSPHAARVEGDGAQGWGSGLGACVPRLGWSGAALGTQLCPWRGHSGALRALAVQKASQVFSTCTVF